MQLSGGCFPWAEGKANANALWWSALEESESGGWHGRWQWRACCDQIRKELVEHSALEFALNVIGSHRRAVSKGWLDQIYVLQ